jgi:hypothetical protein
LEYQGSWLARLVHLKRHGIVSHVEYLMPDFDDLDRDDEAFLEKVKANAAEPDPYHPAPTAFHRLNFGELT